MGEQYAIELKGITKAFGSVVANNGINLNVKPGEILGLIGDTSRVDMDLLKSLEIVETVKRVSEPYKQANRKFHPKDTIIQCGDVRIGIATDFGHAPEHIRRELRGCHALVLESNYDREMLMNSNRRLELKRRIFGKNRRGRYTLQER